MRHSEQLMSVVRRVVVRFSTWVRPGVPSEASFIQKILPAALLLGGQLATVSVVNASLLLHSFANPIIFTELKLPPQLPTLLAVKIVIPENLAEDPCLKKIKKRLGEIEQQLELNITGKTITLQYPDPNADPDTSPQLDPNTAARTDPVKDDADAVTLTVSKNICDKTAHELAMILAHELPHAERLTRDEGHAYRDLYFTYLAAFETLDAAMKRPRVDANILEATKKKKKAKKAALEQLKKEEDDAFDFVKAKKDKLGLTDDDLSENEKWRREEQENIDKLIRAVGR